MMRSQISCVANVAASSLLSVGLALLPSCGCGHTSHERPATQESEGELPSDVPAQPTTAMGVAPAESGTVTAPVAVAPAALVAAPAALVTAPAALADKVAIRQFATGFSRPVGLEVAPGEGPNRVYVVEQVGRIWQLDGGVRARKPLLDIRRQVSRDNEQGLLGLAFHPDYATNHKLYVNYTDRTGKTHIVEYQVAPGANPRVKVASARTILEVDQPYSNHNGGSVEFGPDGKLYVGMGDGGAGGDPHSAGQDDGKRLGKILRINVDGANPTVTVAAKGVRNPWRMSFDSATGDLYVGDVGQNAWEEVDVLPAGADTLNFGWNTMEATHCFKPSEGCAREGMTLPVAEYGHAKGCSITGGEVYRGESLPELTGHYFYADFCSPLLRSLRWSAAGGVHEHWDWTSAFGGTATTISSFGHDRAGELYIVSLGGSIYRFERKQP